MQLKKIFMSLLVVIMVLSTVILGVSAAENDKLTFSVAVSATEDAETGATVAKPGDVVEVIVTIDNNPGASMISFKLAYDATLLKPIDENEDGVVDYASGDLYSFYDEGLKLHGILHDEEDGIITCTSNMGGSELANVAETGKVLTLKFKVLDDVDANVTVSVGNALAYKNDFSSVEAVGGASNICAVHAYATESTIAATCTTAGYTVHTCACGAAYKSDKVDALGHNLVTVEQIDPTCTEDGATKKIYCDREGCGYVELASTVIPATGHTEQILPAVDATCIATGLTEGKKCSVCQETLVAQTEVAATGHTEEVIPAVDATCTVGGSTAGKRCSVCLLVIEAPQTIAPLGHTEEVFVAAVAPTCTTAGSTEGKKCSVCNVLLVVPTVIQPKGHTEVIVPAVEPTYSKDGAVEGKICTECDTVLVPSTPIPAKSLAWLWVLIAAVVVMGGAGAATFILVRKKYK